MGFRHLKQLVLHFPEEMKVPTVSVLPQETDGHVTYKRVVTEITPQERVKTLPDVETMRLKNLIAANAPLQKVPSTLMNPSYEDAAAAFAEPKTE